MPRRQRILDPLQLRVVERPSDVPPPHPVDPPVAGELPGVCQRLRRRFVPRVRRGRVGHQPGLADPERFEAVDRLVEHGLVAERPVALLAAQIRNSSDRRPEGFDL